MATDHALEDQLDRFLSDLISVGVDGAVSRVEIRGRPVLTRAAGADVDGKRVVPSCWFDLASLTKPFVGTLALVLAEREELPLGLAVGDVLEGTPGFLADVTLEDLLRHRSGLRAWLPLFDWVGDETSVLDCLLRDSNKGAETPCYSDLGYILWGLIAERVMGRQLAELLHDYVLVPLGSETLVAATPGLRPEIVACRLDNDVEVRLAKELGAVVAAATTTRRGEPQDGNARYLTQRGGLVGHCGLFGSAEGVAALARGWLTEDLLSRDLREKALGTSDRYALGWWRFLVEPASADVDETARGQTAFDGTRTERTGSEAILKLGSSSFGMVGFTGSSCWVDPSRGLVAVLLAHRQQSGLDLGPWRQRFHQLAMSFCDFPLR